MYSSDVKREGRRNIRPLVASVIGEYRTTRYIDDFLKGERQPTEAEAMVTDWLRERGILERIRWSEAEGKFVIESSK